MKPDAEGGLLVTGQQLEDRLRQELTVTDWRAVIAVVVAAPGLEQAAEQACGRAIEAAGLGATQVIQLSVSRDEAGKEQLEAINRTRDTLLRHKRLVWLRAASAAEVRFLRKTAPDLCSAIDLFVELRTDDDDRSDWPTCREQLRALMEERHSVLDFTELMPATVGQRRLPLAELYQPLVHPRPSARNREGLLVLGHPGTGKTTFVRHLAWDCARQANDVLVGGRVPLLMSLSDYGDDREQDRVRTLIDFLPIWLARQNVESASSISAHLSEVLLLLDGLDELRTPEARRSVLTEVSQLLREERVGGVVVTGRSFLVDELRPHDHLLRLMSTQEPTQPQIQAFLAAFVRLRRRDRASAEHLISRVERDPELRALARTPRMLAFMAVLDELEGRLPDRRIEIHHRLGEMLLERWTRAVGIGTGPIHRERSSRTGVLRVLGSLAWSTIERRTNTISEPELMRELMRIGEPLETPDEAKTRASRIVEQLRADTALLAPQPDGRWAFVHRSFAEYLAGVGAESDPACWAALLDDPFRPEWREVVLFCAGQLGVIEGRPVRLEALVRAVLAKSRRKRRYAVSDASLLMGLLEETSGSSRQWLDELMERLLEVLTRMTCSPAAAGQVRRELVSLLLKAGSPVAMSLERGLRQLTVVRDQRTDWLFRLAQWRLYNDLDARQRTLAEVARELDIDR